MSYSFAKYLLLRLPANKAECYDSGAQTFLADPSFRAAIYVASPVFYDRLRECNFNYYILTYKEKATLLKYINRCCFRPTPFGLFSSVSLATWGDQDQGLTTVDNDLSGVFLPDETFVKTAAESLLDNLASDGNYLTNPTVYRVLKEFRFIRTDVTEDGKRTYQLQATDYSVILKDLLYFCHKPRRPAAVIAHISRLADTGYEESEDYFQFLSDSQVLIHQLRTNITGENHLSVLLEQGHQVQKAGAGELRIAEQLSLPGLTVENIIAYKTRLQELSAVKSPTHIQQPASCVLLRKIQNPELDIKVRTRINQGLFALNRLCPPDEAPALRKFINAFRKDFDGQRLPLLTALDPEYGIGYEVPNMEGPNPLLETLNIHPVTLSAYPGSWTPAHVCLMESWLSMEREQQSIIRLDGSMPETLSGRGELQVSLGLSVLFRVVNEKVYIESAGGNNPLALIGRFTVADVGVADAAREIAKEHELLNPGLLFAELLHLSDPHIDNVNRRAHLWSYELPITAASTLPPEQQLSLDDLYVEVQDDKVFLWSLTHRKYVIPRLSTAYNHSLNKLPLFRFLADLPYQYGRTNLSFDLRQFFPGLSYYPRVEYCSAILSPATWIIPNAILKTIRESTDADLLTVFKQLVSDCRLPEIFIVSDGDQQLVFKQANPQDVHLFKAVAAQRKELIIIEFLNDLGKDAVVRDEAGNAYIHQFNAFILSDQPLQVPGPQKALTTSLRSRRKYMPGSDWLYLKIYCPKLSASRLLLKIRTVISKKFRFGRISKWFFIRYEDHAPHIRLRLNIDPRDVSEILILFRKLLEGHVDQHVIREYQIDVYSRELERYYAAGIALTEDLFWSSSLFVLQYLRLRRHKTTPPAYLAAISSVKLLADELLPSVSEQKRFFQQCYQNMALRYETQNTKPQLDLKYRELNKEIDQALQNPNFFSVHDMAAVADQMRSTTVQVRTALTGTEAEQQEYMHSILHMHLNRIFTDQQPEQEMIVYYLLYKYLHSREGRRKQDIVKSYDPI